MRRSIYCEGCQGVTKARLTDGREIYPHFPDVGDHPFWRCDTCTNYVGCHYKTSDRTRPLGSIPTEAARKYRRQIHRILDPLWKSGRMSRDEVYAILARELGRTAYHTGEIQTAEEAQQVVRVLRRLYGPCKVFPE